VNRLSFAKRNGCRHGIAAVALSPAGWAPSPCHTPSCLPGGPRPQVRALRRSESTRYAGGAVVAPARDGRVMRKSVRTLVGGGLACVYGLAVHLRPFGVGPTAHG
jgi:hypothetical protein